VLLVFALPDLSDLRVVSAYYSFLTGTKQNHAFVGIVGKGRPHKTCSPTYSPLSACGLFPCGRTHLVLDTALWSSSVIALVLQSPP